MTPLPYFPLPLRGEFQDFGERLTLTEPFVFVDDTERIEVPAGFCTDFNSVPRPLWVWFPPWQFPEAAVIHDYLYRNPGGRNRDQCDVIHRRILHVSRCRKSKRLVAYLGLRSGGWVAWNRYRALEAAGQDKECAND